MGYSILLVDDEELAIRGIETGINWAEIEVDRVYKTHSMETAVRMLTSYKIDVLLTDIEMPGGTGLDLIRWARENSPQTVCLFYTAHANFSYAQEAVRLGAADYMLKPTPYPEMQEIFARTLGVRKNMEEQESVNELWGKMKSDNSEESAIEKVKNYIMDHIADDLKREELAAYVYMSEDYLARTFKKSEGCTISDYIYRKRHEIARKLLVTTDLSISEIGIRIGIPNSSYFIKKFRTTEGITPQQYRDDNKTA